MKLRAKSLRRIRALGRINKGRAENTNRENTCRRIASLAVWPFGGAQFSAFWDGNSLQDDGTVAIPVFGYISLS